MNARTASEESTKLAETLKRLVDEFEVSDEQSPAVSRL